jgi:hypothetical protein
MVVEGGLLAWVRYWKGSGRSNEPVNQVKISGQNPVKIRSKLDTESDTKFQENEAEKVPENIENPDPGIGWSTTKPLKRGIKGWGQMTV